MFVYGIFCNSATVVSLPNTTNADYYMEHELLVFPTYNRPTSIRNYGPSLTKRFLNDFKRIAEKPDALHSMELEEPFITEEESALIQTVQASMPAARTGWYYLPC
jgi:hypothetical protein